MFVKSLCAGFHSHLFYCSVRSPMKGTAAADSKTDSCQPHTNKLPRGNQSGGLKRLRLGGKCSPAGHKPKPVEMEGWNERSLSARVVYLLPQTGFVATEQWSTDVTVQ